MALQPSKSCLLPIFLSIRIDSCKQIGIDSSGVADAAVSFMTESGLLFLLLQILKKKKIATGKIFYEYHKDSNELIVR